MTIGKLLGDSKITVRDLAEHLDGLDHAGRMEAMGSTTSRDQQRLWALAAESEPLTLEYFVPEGIGPRTEVVHHGRNTLPVFNTFQKRFARAPDGSPRLFGYNEGSTRPLIGPGYFVAHATAGTPAWEERGAWVVDYFLVPDGPVPEGWPVIKENSRGLQRFVFYQTRDFMRRVSAHVTIGMAFKREKPMNAWFTLVRED